MLRRFALVAAALIVCAGVLNAPAAQAAITVNTTADPGAAGQCSLRKAIQAANTQSAAGDCAAADPLPATTTIIMPAGTYTLASQLEIAGTAKVLIQGASSGDPSQTTIDAAQNSRVLMVDSNAEATLSALTLTGGRTPNGADGGCCRQATTAAFDGAPGGDGGGVYNNGTLTLTDAVVKANSAGAGGRGGDGGAPNPQYNGAGAGGQGGGGGSGGGIYNDFYGTLTLTNTTVTDNHAGHGGNGGAGGSGGSNNPYGNAGGAGGKGGSGGGVFSVVGNHVVTLTDATLSANTAGDGGDANGGGNGDPSASNTGAAGGGGGYGGDGGGLAVYGPFTITQSTVSANVTGIGGTGGGGGLGGNGTQGAGGQGGGGGTGGGVLVGYTQPSSSFSLTNSTIASNTAGHGGNGGVPNGGGGFGGDGGGLWLSDAGTIVYDTITQNHAGSGGFLGGGGAQARDGGGGGLWIQSSQPTASAANTLFASNTTGGGAQNCASSPPGSVADGGHNLSFPDSTCPGSNGDPALGPLQDNGGPTQTMALGGASAALDQIPYGTASCPAVDQRGVSRPYPAGGLCDIGAFELGQTSTPQRTLTVTTSGTGSGTVTGSGIDCGGAGHTDCSEPVADGTTIALSTTSAAGSSFTTFTGGGCGAASPCTVTMNADKTVDAKFNQLPSNSVVAVTPGSLTPPILTSPTSPASPTAPSVTNVTQAHGTWRDGNLLAHLASTRRPPVGTTFAFALSEQAHFGLAFTQRVGGRKVKGRCVAQTKTNRRQGACQRTVTRGGLSFSGHSGTNRVSFQGRISRTKKLEPGRYTLTITATNATGQHSSAKALRFTIVK
jgi:CSLREA domain-containing protein